MYAKVGSTPGPRRVPSYDEFEPFCNWRREESRDTLVIHVPEFKKGQLKVRVDNRGILKISGERPLDTWKRSTFYKELEVPKNCNTNGIQAKFVNGRLHILMPKLTPVAPEQNNKLPQVDASVAGQKTKTEPYQDRIEKPSGVGHENIGTSSTKEEKLPSLTVSPSIEDARQLESSVWGAKNFAKMAVNVGVVVAVLGVYILCIDLFVMKIKYLFTD